MPAFRKTKRHPGGRPRNATTDKVAEVLGVSKRQAENIVSESGGAPIDLEPLKAARLHKLKLESERIALAIAREKGEVIARADVESEVLAVAAAMKAKLKGWAGSLPGRLEGLSAGQMVPIFDEEVNRLLLTLAMKW